MMHENTNKSGNSRFYGFCIDVLDSVAREVGFVYLIELAPDKKYGALDPDTGNWNGMVFQLMQHVNLFLFFI